MIIAAVIQLGFLLTTAKKAKHTHGLFVCAKIFRDGPAGIVWREAEDIIRVTNVLGLCESKPANTHVPPIDDKDGLWKPDLSLLDARNPTNSTIYNRGIHNKQPPTILFPNRKMSQNRMIAVRIRYYYCTSK